MSTTAMLKYIQEQDLDCTLCKRPLKQPKSLPCLHVFCRACIATHITGSLVGRNYRCPTCKESHKLPENGVNSLRDAFFQRSLLEISSILQRKAIACSSCDSNADAESACSICGDYLCGACVVIHSSQRRTQSHELTSMEDLRDSNNLSTFQRALYNPCDEHPTQTCTLYCKTDRHQICNTCTFAVKHQQHDIVTLEDKLKDLKDEVDSIRVTAGGSTHEKRALKAEQRSIKEALERKKNEEKQSLQELTTQVEHVIKMIRKYEQRMTHEIREHSQTKKYELEQRLEKVNSELGTRDTSIQNAAILDLFPTACAVQVAKEIIRKGMSEAENESTLEEFNLENASKENRFRCDFKSELLDMYMPTLKLFIGYVPSSINSWQLYRKGMFHEMENKAKSSAETAVTTIAKTTDLPKYYHRIAAFCVKKMTEAFDGHWQCIVGAANHYADTFTHSDKDNELTESKDERFKGVIFGEGKDLGGGLRMVECPETCAKAKKIEIEGLDITIFQPVNQ